MTFVVSAKFEVRHDLLFLTIICPTINTVTKVE